MSRPRNRRPVRSAAISVVPEPRKMSSTSSPRRVTSWMRIGDQRRRLHRRVQRQVLAPAAGHRVHRGVVPDVGAVAAVPAELDGVEVRRLADPVDEDQLVLRAVERAHAGVRLVPDAEVQELAVDRAADRHDVLEVPPVHADEVHRAVARHPGAGAERLGRGRLRNAASLISPEAMANSRCRPLALAWPLIRTL